MAIAGTLTYKTELDTSGVQKSGNTVKSIIAGLGITKIISKAMSVINASLDEAITRVDTLNNFPRVMSNLGIGAEESSKSIKLMSDKLAGLPTTLDQGAKAVQRFTSANGDVEKSTEIFLALNNAILAGGAGTEIQASALEQMSQAYAKGKPDMMEWRTIMSAMPAQLKQVATAMGYVNASELGEDLRSGVVSMDEFTDAIIRLNKQGIDGLVNFETQAKNATGGIQTSIVVAKTQVVKGLSNIVNSIDKGLKKSGTSINKIITNIGKKAKEVLDKIGKALSKIDFKALFNIIQKLIPVVSALVTGFVAYQGVLKVLELGKVVTGLASMASTFISLVPTITSAGTAMTALSTAFAVSPIGLVVAGVAGLTAGLILLNNEAEKNKTDIQKMNDVLNEYDNTMKQADKTRQKYLDTNMNELANTEALWKELQLLVDENGKVKEGYEDRVNFILGELNNALGTEMTMTDGVVKGYRDIKNSINEIIQQKRAKILIDAEESKYNKAKDEAVKLEENYAKAQTKTNEASEKRGKYLNELIEKYGLTGTQITDLTTKYQVLDENGKVILSNFDKEVQKLQELDTNYRNANNTLTEAGKKYAENQEIIGNYELSLKNLADGNYSAVLKMYEDTTNYQAKTNEETAKNYQGAIDSQKAYLQYLKDNKSSYDEEVYNNEVKAVEERIALLESEQKKAQKETEASQSKMKEITKQNTSAIKDIWSMSLSDQVKLLKDKKVEFKETADGHIQAYIDGQETGTPKTKKQAEKMVKQIQEELKKEESQAKNAGLALTQGQTQGIEQGQGSTFSAVRRYANNIIANLQDVLGIHSPSTVTRGFGKNLDEGIELGIEDGERDTLKTINEFGNDIAEELSNSMDISKEIEDMYKEMNKTIQMENAKLNFDVSSNDLYNKSLQLPARIDLNAEFEGKVPVQVELDGETIWENQQKINLRKSVQYGGAK